MKKLVIGILAHVDSGKTTLAEALLYRAGTIRKAGRVDHGDSFMDTDPMERNRGITIFSSQAQLQWKDTAMTLLDTPGHVDFSAETERTLSVLDAAVLLISANEGVQAHTRTLWKLLRDYEIPTMIFVNKMDLSVRKQSEMMELLKADLDPACVDFSKASVINVDGREAEAEAFLDDLTLVLPDLMETVLAGEIPNDSAVQEGIRCRQVFPCYFGSAIKEEGAEELLDGMARFFPDLLPGMSPADTEAFGARCYKIGRDERGERLAFLKVTAGELHVKDKITIGETEEKVNQIRVYSGSRYETRDMAARGEVIAVCGLSTVRAGDPLGEEPSLRQEVTEPYLQYSVHADGVNERELFAALAGIGEEATELSAEWNRERGECTVRVMGEVQLEVLADILQNRFGIAATFGNPMVLYRETVTKTVEGMGHFEPLRHYAEVHLILEPGERGSGLFFDSSLSEDVLDRNWQRLILTHLQERVHPGVLIGAPITDMKITLAAGRAHKKHTSGGDFREAVYRAVRAGLMKGESILLEPWLRFRAQVPADAVGKLMMDVRRMGGTFGEPELADGRTVLTGRAPASELMGYGAVLRGYTQGSGVLEQRLDGYDVCHNAEEVIAASGYDPDRDPNNLSASVFTEKGGSELVPWEEAEARMHLPPALSERGEVVYEEETPESLRRKAEAYRDRLASDAELRQIFERTYGAGSMDRKPRRKEPKRIDSSTIPKVPGSKRRTLSGGNTPEVLLVDGYNVIHDWDELRELSLKDYGAARQRLIEILCNYAGFSGDEIHLIFDAYKVKGGLGHARDFYNIEVVFTGEDETADSYIERVSGTIPRDRRVRVVSSDGKIQQIALGHGALRTSAEEFLEQIRAAEEMIRSVIETTIR